ncbi:hypothetical protein D3C81_1621370 [compost metagenome]
MRVTSWFSRLTISLGVPAGASRPAHELNTMPSKPASCMVGTCGSAGDRLEANTASGRSLPALIIAIELNGSMVMSTSPDTTACICGPVPLYEALTTSGIPAVALKLAPISSIMLLPADRLSGRVLDLASATNSCTVLAGTDGCTTITKPILLISEIGAKLFSGS